MENNKFMTGISNIKSHFGQQLKKAGHAIREHADEIIDDIDRGMKLHKLVLPVMLPSLAFNLGISALYQAAGYSQKIAFKKADPWLIPTVLLNVAAVKIIPPFIRQAPELRRIAKDAFTGIGHAFQHGPEHNHDGH